MDSNILYSELLKNSAMEWIVVCAIKVKVKGLMLWMETVS